MRYIGTSTYRSISQG